MNNTETFRFSNQQIEFLRGKKNTVDPKRPYSFNVEKERLVSGSVEDVATIFLTNSECPFRCLMCDLWANTTDDPVDIGDIPGQIRWVLDQLDPVMHIKLYNSGNFFDSRAIPPADYKDIADTLLNLETVTVECHPRLIKQSCIDFSNMLNADLEIAIGLETVHPKILPFLNKQMETNDFERSVLFLKNNRIRSRAFILLKTPLMTEKEGVLWAKRSIEFAFECGVECCVVIPTRSGNGAMDNLKKKGLFSEPTLDSLEDVLEFGIGLQAGRVFADLWDVKRISSCSKCLDQRKDRMNEMNLSQIILPSVNCKC